MKASNKTVIDLIDDNYRKQVMENRHYLKTLAEVLRLTAIQNISQRGHRESSDIFNRGNFLGILNVVAQHDEIVQRSLAEGSSNAKYTHQSIQNAILNIISNIIRDEIRSEIATAEYYSIICDETKDLSKREQLSLVVRYVYNEFIHEEFIGYSCAEELNGESLYGYMKESIKNMGLDLQRCVSQSYDGANVMS